MTQNNGKQFEEPTFTPPDDLSDLTYELPDEGFLYFVEDNTSPVWRCYALIDGAFVDVSADEQERARLAVERLDELEAE